MQSVHESFTNYEFHEFHELACADRLLRTRISRISRIGLRRQAFTNYEFHEICRRPTSARSNFTNWLAQTGFYEHESHEFHESHELIIMTTNLTNLLVAHQKPVPVILLSP